MIVNNELDKIWIGAFVVQHQILLQRSPGETKKTT
jgi:hypothetical protein